jgi:hypothetical protein
VLHVIVPEVWRDPTEGRLFPGAPIRGVHEINSWGNPNTMKRITLAASAVVLAAGLTACGGGGSGAPADASAADFCETQVQVLTAGIDFEDSDEVADEMNAWGDKLAEVGTPEDMSDEARAGFELTVERAQDVSASDLEKSKEENEGVDASELQGLLDDEFSDEEQDQLKAYNEYVSQTCADEIQEAMTELMGDMDLGGESTTD